MKFTETGGIRTKEDNKQRVNVMLSPDSLRKLQLVSDWKGWSRSRAIEEAIGALIVFDPSEPGGGGGAALKAKARPARKA